MSILLVDDVKLSIAIGMSYLEDKGHKVFSASNGREALELLKENRPDLLITDLYMPEMNGDELCREVKNNPLYKGLPVVIMTSADSEENMERCKKAGCDGILKKPYNKGDIIDSIKDHIDIVYRVYKRSRVNFDVSYSLGKHTFSGRVTDISRGGMFVTQDETLPPGAEANFSLIVNGESSGFTADGRVVRVVPKGSLDSYDHPPGIGVAFKSASSSLMDIINHQLAA